MNLVTRIIALIMLAALAGCAATAPRAPAVYTEQATTTVEINTTVGEYEEQAGQLQAIHAGLSAACRAGAIPAADCAWANVVYQECRQAFLTNGNRYKEWLADPSPENRKRYDFAAADFANLYAQLRELARKHGIEVQP